MKDDKKIDFGQIKVKQPKTVMEAIEDLETFLCADFGQKDWSVTFLQNHFKICKDQVKKLQSNKQFEKSEIYKIL